MSGTSDFRSWWQKLGDHIARAFGVSREISRAWDGTASRWPSTDSFCESCLIDVNAAAGRDEKAQSHCKLPVKNPGSDAFDFEGIQAAAGGRGITAVTKPDDVPQDAWDSAVESAANTIISQYTANGETAPDSVYEVAGKEPPAERAINIDAIYEAMWGAADQIGMWAWPMGLYHDDDQLFAVVTSDGKLWKADVMIEDSQVSFGEWIEVVEEFVPRTKTIVNRQTDGRWRWFSISATAVLNRVGEIDSRDLFDSFVARALETGEYPFRTFFHCGEVFRMGQADFLAREGDCYITSGLYDDPDENIMARADIEAHQREPDFWGESIGYRPSAPADVVRIAGIDVPVYRSGENVEISTVPSDSAASLFTTTMISMEVTRMSKALQDALMRLFDGDEALVEAAMSQVDDVNRAISDQDLITRQLGELDRLLAEEITDDARRADILAIIRQMASGDAEPAGDTQDDGDAGDPDRVPVYVDEQLADEIVRRIPATAEFQTAIGGIVAETVQGVLGDLPERFSTVSVDLVEQVEAISERMSVLEQTDKERQKKWLADLPGGSAGSVFAHAVFRPSQERKPEPGPDAGGPQRMADVVKERSEGLPTY